MIDSHCHLDDERFDEDRDEVIERALAAGVEAMMTIGTGDGPPDLEVAIRLAERYPSVWATVGVHPHNAAKAAAATIPRLAALAGHPKVLAIGEIGLDYHYDFSPRDVQRGVFADQLALAREAGKPIVIHTREAWEDTLDIIERHWPAGGPGGIMHCFSGGPDEARRCLAMGFHLSFGGIVTFPKAANVREAAKITPIERLLVETDAPYLAPAPYRGKRNEPAFVVETVRRLAADRGSTAADMESATTAAFLGLMPNMR